MSDCFVYCMTVPAADPRGTQLFKVGITSSLNSRLQAIKTACPYPVAISWTWRLIDRATAQEIERRFHTANKASRLAGEWFNCYPTGAACQIDRICCELWAERGFTFEQIWRFASFAGMSRQMFEDTMLDVEVLEACR